MRKERGKEKAKWRVGEISVVTMPNMWLSEWGEGYVSSLVVLVVSARHPWSFDWSMLSTSSMTVLKVVDDVAHLD